VSISNRLFRLSFLGPSFTFGTSFAEPTRRKRRRPAHRRWGSFAGVVLTLGGFWSFPRTVSAQDTVSPNNEYRIAVSMVHPIAGPISGSGDVQFRDQLDKEVRTYRLAWPGAIYKPARWIQVWGGLITFWSDNQTSPNSWELRPYTGLKLSVPNQAQVDLYNLTRLEWRHVNETDGGSLQHYQRLRNRVGAEFPLSTRAWEPDTYYGLADLETLINLQENFVESLRFRGGAGYVISRRVRVEGQYNLQVNRSSLDEPLTFDDNVFRFNVKLSLREGLLEALGGGH
jgi:hypothetical protein